MKKLLAILIIFGFLGSAVQVQAFDLTRYAELKASGHVYFTEMEGMVYVVKKKYDQEVGTEISLKDNRPLAVDRDSLAKQRTRLQSLIGQYDLFLTDYDAAVLAAGQP